MSESTGKRSWSLGSWRLPLLAAVMVFLALLNYQRHRDARAAQAREAGVVAVEAVAQHISVAVERLVAESHGLAERLKQRQVDDLATEIETISRRLGVVMTACFEPYAWDSERARLCRYYDEETELSSEWNGDYDYRDAKEERARWYVDALAHGEARWGEPYWGTAGHALYTDYAVPLDLDVGGEGPDGLVVGSYTSSGLTKLLRRLELGASGYGVVVARGGRVAVYPDETLVSKGVTLAELATAHDHPAMNMLQDAIERGGRDAILIEDPVSGRPAWVFHARIPANGWTVALVLDRQETLGYSLQGNRSLMMVVFAVLLLALTIVWALVGRAPSREFQLWTLSTAITVALGIATATAWGVELLRFSGTLPRAATPVETSRLVEEYADRLKVEGDGPPIVVPTGVLIRNVHFADAFETEVSGHIWQRYPRDADLERTVLLTELAPDAEAFSLSESYRVVEGESELVGWFFRARLRHEFSLRKYPFDHRDVSLTLTHPAVHESVMLVPDYESYSITNPSALPGVARDIPSPGWGMERSMFAHRAVVYDTNFGRRGRVGQVPETELSYHVFMRREVVGPFITRIVPMLAIAAMLFGVQLVASRNRERSALSGFSTVGALESCAAFFFVVIVSHIDLRSELEVGHLFYLEYFFFVTYAAILWVGINSLLLTVASREQAAWIHRDDNLWSKLLFGPAFAGAVFLCTMWVFF